MYICEHLGNIHVCVFSAKLLGKENKKKLRQRLSVSFFLQWSLALSEKVAACRVFPRSGDWCVCVPCSLDSITSKSTVTDTFFFVSSKKRKRWTSTETDRGAETFGGRQQVMNPSSWGVWLIHLNETVFIFFHKSLYALKILEWNRETLLPYSRMFVIKVERERETVEKERARSGRKKDTTLCLLIRRSNCRPSRSRAACATRGGASGKGRLVFVRFTIFSWLPSWIV